MSVRQQPPAPDRADRADRAPPTNALWSDALTIPPGVKIAARPPTRPVSLHAVADARARVAPTRRRASAGDALDLDAMFAAKAALLRPTAGRAAYDDAEEPAPMPSFTEWKARRAAETGGWADGWADGVKRRMGMGKPKVVDEDADEQKPDAQSDEAGKGAKKEKEAPSPSASAIRRKVGLDQFDLLTSRAGETPYVIAAARKEHRVKNGKGSFKAEEVAFTRPLDFETAKYVDSDNMKLYKDFKAGAYKSVTPKQLDIVEKKIKADMISNTSVTTQREQYAPEILYALDEQFNHLKGNDEGPDENLKALLGFMMMGPEGEPPRADFVSAATVDGIEAQLKNLALTRDDVKTASELEKGTPYMVPYSNEYEGEVVSTLKSVSAFVALPFPPIKERKDGGDPLKMLATNYIRQPAWNQTDDPSGPDTRYQLKYKNSNEPRYIPDAKDKLTSKQLRRAFSHMLYPVHVTMKDDHKNATVVHWGSHPIFVPREETDDGVVNDNFRAQRMGERRLQMTPAGKTILSKWSSPSRDILNYRVVHESVVHKSGGLESVLFPIADAEMSHKMPPVHLDMLVAWTARKLGYGLNAVKNLKPGPGDVELVEAANAITSIESAQG